MKTFMTLAAAAGLLAGCATIADGTQQTISLDSNVEGALCGISQNGQEIVAAAPVPTTHLLPRVSGNLIVTCTADGYETSTVALMSGKNPKTVVLAMPVMLFNAGADRALGGIDEYQDRAYIHLKRARVAAATE